MNAWTLKPAPARLLPAWRLKLRRRQLGFALYEAGRRPGLPGPLANAQARFEYEARRAGREWLML
ncbi:MAG TPA: hypothetical protein VNU21_14885 [Usitatibacter sp.]|jgi:hypothetical protein|nr:hypothetical protein [Usitatibacter sp.]